MRLGRGLLLLLLIYPPLLLSAELASELLRRMSEAMRQLNYEGTFVYSHNGSIQTMRVIHGVDKGDERERLVSLDGPSREIVRDRQKVTYYLPDDQAVFEERVNPGRSLPIILPERLERIRLNYRIHLLGEGRAAGSRAHRIAITPRDSYRYGHRIWLDQDSSLLLRAETLDEHGATIEKLIFTRIALLQGLPDELLMPRNVGPGLVWQRQESEIDETVEQFDWDLGYLPPGFAIKTSRRHRMPDQGSEVEHQVYRDGMSSISVFVEPLPVSGQTLNAGVRRGALSVTVRDLASYRVVVIGEVPPATVERVAGSIRLQGETR